MDRPDRRRYFRIDDLVGLSYRLVDVETAEEDAKSADNIQITAIDLLKSIDQELTEVLNTLWQSSPAAANAIGLLNKKIDIIAAEIDLDYDRLRGLDVKSKQVNLSACGMAFECQERFDIGQVLILNIVLKPANTHVRTQGRIVGCDWLDGDEGRTYLLRVDFDCVGCAEEEQLIQHIVRRQANQIGNQRLTEE
ncbi:MAG: PilZ domain-containing protein [Pseudomonadales bacterium]|nr:PilZ domain-containing protein [Pseudomonadales bacterium]MCP5213741.1 PilZ domain-containing protein [Pseudomonadales bacterium]